MATLRTTLDRMPATRAPKGSLTGMILTMVDSWIERHRQRNALLGLNDAMLKDIGVSRADALREGGKAFWTP